MEAGSLGRAELHSAVLDEGLMRQTAGLCDGCLRSASCSRRVRAWGRLGELRRREENAAEAYSRGGWLPHGASSSRCGTSSASGRNLVTPLYFIRGAAGTRKL